MGFKYNRLDALEVLRDQLKLIKFTLPILVVPFARLLAQQFVFRSISSSVDDLSIYGLIHFLVTFLLGFLQDFCVSAMVLVKNRSDYQILLSYSLFSGFLVSIFLLMLGVTPLGTFVFSFFTFPTHMTGWMKILCMSFSFYPIIESAIVVHNGLLLQQKQSCMVGISSFINVVTQILVCLTCPHFLDQEYALIIPVLALYLGNVFSLIFLLFAFKCNIKTSVFHSYSNEPISFNFKAKIVEIFGYNFSLSFMEASRRVGRSIVNLFTVADRGVDYSRDHALLASSVMFACYPVIQIPYMWLQDLKLIEPARTRNASSTYLKVRSSSVKIFFSILVFSSFIICVCISWPPNVTYNLMSAIGNVNENIASLSVTPMRILCFNSLIIGFRAYIMGHLTALKKTKFLGVTVFVRIAVLLSCLHGLSRTGIHGTINASLSQTLSLASEVILIFAVYIYVTRMASDSGRQSENMPATEVMDDEEELIPDN